MSNYPQSDTTVSHYPSLLPSFKGNSGVVNGTQNGLTYNFVRAFPIAVASMPVSYDASQLLKCTVSMAYTRYFIDSGKSGQISDLFNPLAQAAGAGIGAYAAYNLLSNPAAQTTVK